MTDTNVPSFIALNIQKSSEHTIVKATAIRIVRAYCPLKYDAAFLKLNNALNLYSSQYAIVNPYMNVSKSNDDNIIVEPNSTCFATPGTSALKINATANINE